jgi:hypothetical protein
MLPRSATALCAGFGFDLFKFVHPKKLRAQYRFLAAWLATNS